MKFNPIKHWEKIVMEMETLIAKMKKEEKKHEEKKKHKKPKKKGY